MQFFRFCLRHLETYSTIIQENTHACSEPRVLLAYSEPWHISIKKHIQTSRYIHNTILNIFTKAPSWTFDTVPNVLLFYRWYLTSRVTLRRYLLTLYFRHMLAYSVLIQSYLFLLRYIKNPIIFRKTSASAIRRHILNATHNI